MFPAKSGNAPRRTGWLAFLVLAVSLFALLAWKPMLQAYYLGKAKLALADRDAQAALDLMQARLRLDPRRADTHFWLARIYRHLGDFERVNQRLKTANRLGHPSKALEREQWLALAQSGQLTEAEPHLQELLANPGADGREILDAFVNGYFLNLRLDSASLLLDTWESSFPDDPQPHFRRGFLQQSFANWTAAAKSYRRGLALAPQRTDARARLAKALLEMNKIDDARDELTQVLEEAPENRDAKVDLATCLIHKGQRRQAKALLLEVAEQRPDHLEARTQLAHLAMAEGDHQTAVCYLEALNNEAPFNPKILMALSQAYQAIGKNERAKDCSALLVRVEQMQSRLEDLMAKILERPSNTQLRYEVAMLLVQLAQEKDAARWLRSILEIDSENPKAHQALARLYRNAKEFERAQWHQQQVEKLERATSDG